MALINCPECGKNGVSDAGTCPGCGLHIKEYFAELKEESARKKEESARKEREAKERNEREKKDELRQQWEARGLCGHCGGSMIEKGYIGPYGIQRSNWLECTKCGSRKY